MSNTILEKAKLIRCEGYDGGGQTRMTKPEIRINAEIQEIACPEILG
jgi:hypothetical protein